MTTAAMVNDNPPTTAEAPQTSGEAASPESAGAGATANQALKKTSMLARGLADDASRAIGNLLPKASLQNLTARKYTLPDKTVASQVLMYRQLLHTKCRPGLKLSRPFQGTPAQRAVMHMPWWEEGIEESKKMVISYHNLISRLWLNGAIMPFQSKAEQIDLLSDGSTKEAETETFIGEDGLPPIPHKFWVERLGFQQQDPVTDFRSGGVLSLGMMVYMVESCPAVCERFFSGDASVLPFGITCINVTDMIAKFLMLAKSTDRMDALLSQKPFWKMFGDPNAILAVQELALTMLADVVVELTEERKVPGLANNNDNRHGESDGKVTVFDFSMILERAERRVRDDLLGAGPKTVDELRSIAGRLRVKYQKQLERRIEQAKRRNNRQAQTEAAGSSPSPQQKVAGAFSQAGNVAGGFFSKLKPPSNAFAAMTGKKAPEPASAAAEPAPTIVAIPEPAADTEAESKPTPAPTSGGADSTDGDWIGADMTSASDAISNFSIGDDDDSL